MQPNIMGPATDLDIPCIQSVARRSWADVYEGIIAAEIQDRALTSWYSSESLLDAIQSDRSIFLVATSDDDVIGFIQIVKRPDGIAEITRIYVAPDEQRQGTGTMLFQDALDRLRSDSVSELVVSVEAQNLKGRSFYESIGFTPGDTSRIELFGYPLEMVTYRREPPA